MSSKQNILVIEDDQFTQEFYHYVLTRVGFNVIVLEESEKIFNCLDTQEIILIIMDVNLKNTYYKGDKIDGIVLSRKIKSDPRFSNIPLILITAYTPSIKGTQFFDESLADEFIIKPIVDFNILIEKINKLIAK